MDLMEKNMELIEVQKLEGHTDRVWNAAWNPVSPILASCSGDNTVRIWEQSSLSRSWSCKVPLDLYLFKINIILNLSILVLLKRPKLYLILLCVVIVQTVLEETHTRTVRSCSWSPSGKLLATASFDGTTAIWEDLGDEFECISTLEVLPSLAPSLIFFII